MRRVNPSLMTQARQMPSPLRRLGAHASLAEIGSQNMTKIQSLAVAALLSGAAAVAFAQTPAAPAATLAPVPTVTTAATTAPVHSAKPVHRKHHRHHAKKAATVTATPAAAAAAPVAVK